MVQREIAAPAAPSRAVNVNRRISPLVAYGLICVALLGLAAFAADLYRDVKRELTDVALARRLAVAQLAAATLSERLDRMVELTASLATRVRFTQLVAAGRWRPAIEILRDAPSQFQFIDRLVLYDTRGTLMADVPALPGVKGKNFAYRDWFQGVSRGWKPYVSVVYRRAAQPQKQVFAVAVPVLERGAGPAGVLQLQVDLDSFFDWTKAIDIGPGGSAYVVDRRGSAVFDSAFPIQHELIDLSMNPAVAQLLRGKSGVEIAAGGGAAQQLYAFVPARHGWGVVVQQPAAQAFAARENQLRRLLVGYGLIAVFFTAAAGLAVHLLKQQRRMRALNDELEDLYNQAPCGYHSVDENGLMVRMNDTWLRWLGYARHEVVGKKKHADLMTPQSAERFWREAFPLFKKQGWLKEVEFDYVRKDGTTFPGSLQTSTVYDSQGRYVMSRTTVFDISHAKDAERALRESEQRIRLVVEGVRDYAILTLDPQGRITSWNSGAELIKGYPAGEALGQHFSIFYPRDEIDAGWPERELELAASRGHFEDEGWRVRKDGGRFWANVVITAMRDEAGMLRGYSKITRDLSERKRAEEAVQALNKELESFTYSVSHDLRAPLRAVDGYARMLEEDCAAKLDDAGRRLLSVVRHSSQRMGHLIDDLLAFSRLGRQEPSKHALDMTGLAREVVEELRSGSAAGIELGELPRAQADRALMRQVWLNLVGNALKYSRKRSDARIEIGGREEAGGSVYWVRDNGVGFDMRYSDKLFGVFQRLHRQEEFEGTGVGLAIVQRVVARHGGRVWGEGKPGEGACFWFSLPKEA